MFLYIILAVLGTVIFLFIGMQVLVYWINKNE